MLHWLPRMSLAPALACGLVLASASLVAATTAERTLTRAEARLELGERLFFDPILSSDRTISCASCHKPELAFADNVAFSPGIGGAPGIRNTPTVMNVSGRTSLFWDGKAETLEDQAIFPIENPIEMNLPIDEAVSRLNAHDAYQALFAQAYGGPATARAIGRALAEYQKSLNTFDTPYDRWNHGDETAISDAAKRGRTLFVGKAKCGECHFGEDFTSDRFRNIGLYDGQTLADRGRGEITGHPDDHGLFKIPTLRNVALTAPYMHNGMFETLREVIEYYNDPDKIVPSQIGRDPTMAESIGLTEQEIDDIEAFLLTLTDDRFAAKGPGTP